MAGRNSSAKGRTMMEVGSDGVAVVVIINPPVNSLSLDVLYSLKDSYEQALRRNDVKAIVITGANGKFSGGFDISAFGGLQSGKVEQPKPGFIAVDILTNTVEAPKLVKVVHEGKRRSACTYCVDVTPLGLDLGMLQGIVVDLAGAGEEEPHPVSLGEPQHIEHAQNVVLMVLTGL